MKTALKIAFRYLIGKKSRNIINLIAGISVTSIMVISAALIIILSAYNGLESTIRNVYKAVDPELRITIDKGKVFNDSAQILSRIRNIEGVEIVAPVIEENILVMYNGNQQVALIKGVTPEYFKLVRLDTMLVAGKLNLSTGRRPAAIIGEGMAQTLRVNLDNPTTSLEVYYPKRGKLDPFNPFLNRALVPSAIFTIDHEYTNQCMFTSIDFARDFLKLDEDAFTTLEIKLSPGASVDGVKHRIKTTLGPQFKVEDRFEQHQLMYRVMRGERLMVFLIIAFILVIASFNLIGVISLMLVEKKKDLLLLHSLGLQVHLIKSIFLLQGVLITLFGSIAGIIIGSGIALIQKITGFVKISPGENARAFPIDFHFIDFVMVLAIVIFIGFTTSFLRMAVARFDKKTMAGLLK